jgi:hypothetical protein
MLMEVLPQQLKLMVLCGHGEQINMEDWVPVETVEEVELQGRRPVQLLVAALIGNK